MSTPLVTAAGAQRLSAPAVLVPLLRIASILILLGGWQWATASLVDPLWIARPSSIAIRLWDLTASGALFKHAVFTVENALAGLALSVPIGIAFGSSKLFAGTFEFWLLGLNSMPRIALAPLFIVWFGIDEASKIVMTFSMVVFVVILNTYEGMRGTDQELLGMMRAMRARPLYIFRKVRLPSIMSWVLASIRVGIGLALVGSVIGELLGANRGLGWYIELSAARLDMAGVFAGLFVLTAIGIGLHELVKILERRFWLYRVQG
jgi:NitT/TauT family transport system permease protein